MGLWSPVHRRLERLDDSSGVDGDSNGNSGNNNVGPDNGSDI